MNCPICKTPVPQQSSLCEWCGNKIILQDSDYNFSEDGKINITISFEGIWYLFDMNAKIFADDILVGSGSLKNGFHIEFTSEKTQPILLVKHPMRSQKIEIPKLEFGASYEIIIGYSRFWGNFERKPINTLKTMKEI